MREGIVEWYNNINIKFRFVLMKEEFENYFRK